MKTFVDIYDANGLDLIPGFSSADQITRLHDEFDRLATQDDNAARGEWVYGIRGVLKKSAPARAWTQSDDVRAVVEGVIGKRARAIRGVFFDKRPDANWPLPWHQDRTAAFEGTLRPEGFTNWTTKQGVNHAELPLDYLRSMITLRLHLDDCDADTGAIHVLKGAHRDIAPQRVLADLGRAGGAPVPMKAGDLMAISPLTPHASYRVTRECRRRILHVEFCARTLPEGLDWDEPA